MKSYLINTFVFIIFITSSCSSVIQIPVNTPPEITIKDENKTVVIINDINIEELNLQNPKEIEVYNSGIRNLIIALTDSISDDEKLRFVVCDSLIKAKADSMYSTDSFPGYSEFVCREHSASNLLVLNHFEIFFDHTDNYDETDEDDVTTRDYSLGIVAGFALHNSSGALIKSSIVDEMKHHKSRPVLIKWISIDPSVKKAGKNVDLVSYELGRKYRGKFYPSINYDYKQYYTGKVFKEANQFMKKGDWENAKKALLKMAASSDPQIPQEKVAHNLSIVYEALGDVESSKKRY
ncbi:MAG TPA: DUF6340 family protein [Draconibacterium sp.]|nr:DUF6340 family protein [Draconibacterium sp.]